MGGHVSLNALVAFEEGQGYRSVPFTDRMPDEGYVPFPQRVG